MTDEINLKQAFENFIKFISRNKKLILGIVLSGMISVVSFQKLKKPYFETKAICMSGISEYERQEQVEDLSQRTAIDLINFLQINIDNKDYKELSVLLNIDPLIANQIKQIEAEQLYQKDKNELFYALNKFEIRLTLFDNSQIEDVQNGLVFYFDNNKVIRTYYEEYQKSCDNLIRDIDSEIEALNTFRDQNSTGQFAVGAVNTLGGKNKSISNEIIALSHIREDIILNRKLLKPLVFVQDFAKVNKEEDDVFIWIILGGFISFVISIFVAQVKEVL